jgi:hypothetical protein
MLQLTTKSLLYTCHYPGIIVNARHTAPCLSRRWDNDKCNAKPLTNSYKSPTEMSLLTQPIAFDANMHFDHCNSRMPSLVWQSTAFQCLPSFSSWQALNLSVPHVQALLRGRCCRVYRNPDIWVQVQENHICDLQIKVLDSATMRSRSHLQN